MKILVDADGCPVVEETIRTAKRFSLPVLLVCDTSHEMQRQGAETLIVSKGADSADFALVGRAKRGDIVVTQDYGLAAMALAEPELVDLVPYDVALNERLLNIGYLEKAAPGVPAAHVNLVAPKDPAQAMEHIYQAWERALAQLA